MQLNQIYIFRILHIDNIDFILRAGKLTTYNNTDRDPNYTGIGEQELIGLRADHEITTSHSNNRFCPSCEFLPFYFQPKSVMLYKIQKEFGNLPENIIYVVYKLEDILEDVEFLFTDGHGYARMTQWFDDIAHLEEIDWNIVNAAFWANTDDDSDRKRRKQAEFWIHEELPLDNITGIAVYNEACKTRIDALCAQYEREIEVKVKPNYYYT